jgi:hypothetical protein
MGRLKNLLVKPVARVLIVLLLLGVNTVGWLAHWSSEPSSTTIHIAADQAPAANNVPTYQPFTSQLFASEVPSGWIIRRNTDTASLSQLVSFPAGSSVNHGQVAATVDMLPSAGLTAVPDYNLRMQDKTKYQKQTTNLTGVSALFLDENGTTGYTAFMVHGSRYAAVTVSQFATPDESYAMLRHVVETWKWKV